MERLAKDCPEKQDKKLLAGLLEENYYQAFLIYRFVELVKMKRGSGCCSHFGDGFAYSGLVASFILDRMILSRQL